MVQRCPRCGESKGQADYQPHCWGKQGEPCRSCSNKRKSQWRADNPEYKRQWDADHPRYQKDWIEKHPGASRAYHLKSHYQMTVDQYEAMLAAQGGVCKTCGKPETRMAKGEVASLHVDHAHTCCSGKISCGKCVRGLLCHKCNSTLGYVHEDVTILENMIKYLKESLQ